MVNVEPGEEITLEMKKARVKNYIEIVRLAAGEVEHAEDDESDTDPPNSDPDAIDKAFDEAFAK